MDVDAGWRLVRIGFEGDPTDIGGVDPWKVEWVSRHEQITVAHPQHAHERRTLFVYDVAGTDPPVRFAAGEFSNGVWGFYVPD